MTRDGARTTRRDFLSGKSAVEATTDQGRTEPLPSAENPAPRSYIVQVGRPAMACQFEVLLNAGEHELGTERAIEALDLIDSLEDQLSVYQHRSEVSRLNAIATLEPVPVESRLFELLQSSIELYESTHGAFDMTSAPLIQTWRAARQRGVLPDERAIRGALARVGSDKVRLNVDERTVHFLLDGMTIDLGGIGKGYALDRCSELLSQSGLSDYLIHGGSSSILARGQRQSGRDTAGWTVGVQHPQRPDRRLLEIQLCDQSIGTSGAGTHQFFIGGKRYGHIVDPRSGYPADGIISTTVLSKSAALADALSTSFYVMGLDATESFCKANRDVSAFVITPGDRSGEIELHTFNADGANWRYASSG